MNIRFGVVTAVALGALMIAPLGISFAKGADGGKAGGAGETGGKAGGAGETGGKAGGAGETGGKAGGAGETAGNVGETVKFIKRG